MSLGVRGSNPVWAEFDLAGKIFDDTYWMYVVQNTIPYMPATVYSDPDLNIPLTNPIQFLGNGTLPVDIFFEADVVYRLEFRKNDGITPPSQSDPLIYEVNNYVPGTGGSGPVDTIAFASSNQITNPQFSLMSFTSPFSISGTNPAPLEVGPGWFLDLTGTGSVTLSQVPLNNSNSNPSNAPYALRLQLTGWDVGGVILRQQFQQNGMLWANKIVSSTITARIEGSPQSISATLIDSNSSTLAQVLPLTVINEAWNEFTGYGELPETTNPNTPPSAFIDYKLFLPNNADIYVTSIQLVVQDLPIKPSFDQDSIERQIDHTYHYSYPIVPVGAIIDFAAGSLPIHYLDCDGAIVNRITYRKLFEVIGTTWGAGDGTTTFSLPDLRDRVTAGSGGNLAGSGGITGIVVGAEFHAITIDEMPSHAHPGSTYQVGNGGVGTLPTVSSLTVAGNNSVSVAAQGNGQAMSLVQPTAIVKKIIRYQ